MEQVKEPVDAYLYADAAVSASVVNEQVEYCLDTIGNRAFLESRAYSRRGNVYYGRFDDEEGEYWTVEVVQA